MELFGGSLVLLGFYGMGLYANMCVDLFALSTHIVVLKSSVVRCAVTAPRKIVYGLFENVSIKCTDLKLALSLANSRVCFAHYVRSGAAAGSAIHTSRCVFLVLL